MNPFDPALDQPQSLDIETAAEPSRYLLANSDLRCLGTRLSDLRDLEWPGGGGLYARAINLRLQAFHGDDLLPMVTRYFPGYQETIFGSESLIVSKRLAVPLRSEDDRTLLFSCECQAEADLVVRFDVQIEWGEALSQRIVDGLLVAQRNPQRGRGVYGQSNAESTRVFGNPHARPDVVELDDEAGTAHLVYHALVNGVVDVALLLTLSNVGEQVAWNSFLALRDTERTFDQTTRAWEESLRTARVWTPDPRLNRLIQQGKRATLQNLLFTRAGNVPASRRTADIPALVAGLDALDPRQSRNLLAFLRRTLERTLDAPQGAGSDRAHGRLPLELPADAREPLADPGRALPESNGAWLHALRNHLLHHPSEKMAGEHWRTVSAAAQALVRARADDLRAPAPAEAHAMANALDDAAALARLAAPLKPDAEVEAVLWAGEAADLRARAGSVLPAPAALQPGQLPPWAPDEAQPWFLENPWPAVRLAADAVWLGCGIFPQPDGLHLRPGWPARWEWWAMTGLPLAQGVLSLVWDGATLHSTLPLAQAVASDGNALPVALHRTIRTLHTDEGAFDLTFAFVDEATGPGAAQAAPAHFRPRFLRAPP